MWSFMSVMSDQDLFTFVVTMLEELPCLHGALYLWEGEPVINKYTIRLPASNLSLTSFI